MQGNSEMSELEIIRVRRRGWGRRLMSSIRALTLGPWSLRDPALSRLFGSAGVSSGVHVNDDTAFAVSAFYAAVTTIAWDLASLPLVLFRRLENGGKTRYTTHP